jgi:hypothetical protein
LARTRLVVDLVTEEPLPRRKMQKLAEEMNDWLQAVGSAGIEGRNAQEINMHGHVHVSNNDRSCPSCYQMCQDQLQ